MSTEALASEILAAAEGVTTLPWSLEPDPDEHIIVSVEAVSEIARLPRYEGAGIDAAFIVTAVNAAPGLAREVLALTQKLEDLSAAVRTERAALYALHVADEDLDDGVIELSEYSAILAPWVNSHAVVATLLGERCE